MFLKQLLPLATAIATLGSCSARQHVFGHASLNNEALVQEMLAVHDDPVAAMIALHPESADFLASPRLLDVMSSDMPPQWLTEGDKMRLRRQGIDFIDLTGRDLQGSDKPSQPRLPKISHQNEVKKALPHLSTIEMMEMLDHFSGYYNRLYTSPTGVESQQWLFNEILDIVRKASPLVKLSVELFPHDFPQSSIIARFSPSGKRNVSQPVTVIGAHLDSVNNLFPTLNAPGADDDGSGSATILEAFRVLVQQSFDPIDGPVELHWYAGEEAGLLGSLDIAEDYRSRGINVGAMLNVDETAYLKANSTPAINLVTVGATEELSKWVYKLAKEYCDVDVIYSGMVGRGSDHQSWTKHGYPAAMVVEGDQAEGGWLPFPHTVMDRTDLANGEFSYTHMREFAKVVVAFAIEQAGFVDHNWRPPRRW